MTTEPSGGKHKPNKVEEPFGESTKSDTIELDRVLKLSGEIKAWLGSLADDELDAVATIQDEQFVATLLSVFSTWSIGPRGNQEQASSTNESADNPSSRSPSQLNFFLSEIRVPVTEVEEVYKSFVFKMGKLSQAEAQPSSSDSQHASGSKDEGLPILDALVSDAEDVPATTGGVGEHGETTQKEELTVEEPSTVSNIMEQEEFRIRCSSGDRIDELLPVADAESIVTTESVEFVFPSIVDFIARNRAFSEVGSTSRNGLPILYVSRGATSDFDSLATHVARCSLLSEDIGDEGSSPSWVSLLFHRCGKDAHVSLATIIQARLEVAFVEAFQQAAKPLESVPEDELGQSSPSAGSESDEKLTLDSKPRSVGAAVAMAKHLSSFATHDDIAKVAAALGDETLKTVATIPFSGFARKLQGNAEDVVKCCTELNAAVESVVASLWERAQTSDVSVEVEPPTPAEVSPPVPVADGAPELQSSGTTSRRRRRRNKTKKKKKAPSVDPVTTVVEPEKIVVETEPEAPPSVAENHSPPAVEPDPEGDKEVADEREEQPVVHTKVEVPLPEAISFDSDRTVQSEPNEVSSTARESVRASDDGIRISRVEGLGTIVVAPATAEPCESVKVEGDKDSTVASNDEEDAWETVESKSRNNRNRRHADLKVGQVPQVLSGGSASSGSGNRKPKGGRLAGRKRNANRKMVKDILGSILDAVDEEVLRRSQKQEKSNDDAKKPSDEAKKQSVDAKESSEIDNEVKAGVDDSSKFVSMRDVIMRRHGGLDVVDGSVSNSKWAGKGKSSPQKTLADQNTAPTVPETWSGTSANTLSTANTDGEVAARLGHRAQPEENGIGDSSSGEVVDETEAGPEAATIKEQDSFPPPPLPTLLGPGNSNSATSSVASSLEAPHVISHRHHHHHHSSFGDEDAVGYHLLDVCERLSRDMNVFMERRASALAARRRERGVLLSALQETVSAIWAGHGHVEMYGSCATQLDLPSSDIDTVIRGLDPNHDPVLESNHASSKSSRKQSKRQEHMDSPSYNMSPYLRQQQPYSLNGDRVLKLAAELERQPWAVQVKAIPTASVPVVKMLADPSRLPGATSTNNADWIFQHHHIPGQSVGDGMNHLPPRTADQPQYFASNHSTMLSSQQVPQSHFALPWRGADVMNGLFSIDITFEGREHGGIGSTAFSAHVVQEACNETGLPPERTPVVQVLMVLKELLAQRRLNEPFSGGLSSYALLLLVVAMLKERRLIREEMERIERHRRGLAMAASAPNIAYGVAQSAQTPCQPSRGQGERTDKDECRKYSTTMSRHEVEEIKTNDPDVAPAKPIETYSANVTHSKKEAKLKPTRTAAPLSVVHKQEQRTSQLNKELKSAQGKSAPKHASSSWASIARKNTDVAKNEPGHPAEKSQQPVTKLSASKRISSFAEAVSGKQAHKPKGSAAGGADKSKKKEDCPKDIPKDSFSAAEQEGRHQKEGNSGQSTESCQPPKHVVSHKGSEANQATPEASLQSVVSIFPQGSNDVLEVLCSGETTAGKLLMHFLLFYGQHFDARSTAIDVSGIYHPDYEHQFGSHHIYFSPYIPRRSGGAIDPVSGMLTVDPIVIYDPWDGAKESSNVARSCYAWSSIRWHFAQCYMTLSSAIERSATPPTTPAMLEQPLTAATAPNAVIPSITAVSTPEQSGGEEGKQAREDGSILKLNNNSATAAAASSTPAVDLVSPLLELLLSF